MTTPTDFKSETNRWQAVVQRNPKAVGKFVYAVITTGIFCKPTCSSRKPNKENVRFFDNWQMAEKNGFRACKRCSPNVSNIVNFSTEIVVQACKIIEEAEKEPSLNQLAEGAGLSSYHFHRIFKNTVGITPKQYAMEHRLNRVRSNLLQNSTVTEAVYEAGFESGSRFYETSKKALGMKPSSYKKGGEGLSIRYAIAKSYLGWVLAATTEHGICKIDFDDMPDVLLSRLKADFPQAECHDTDSEFKTIMTQTIKFLAAPSQGCDLPLDVQGTAFQRRVWAALQTIPPGSTASYSEIAKKIGNPKAARAVAQACAANHIAVAIPCHRVVCSNGDLGGYRWGIERKKTILEKEKEAEIDQTY